MAAKFSRYIALTGHPASYVDGKVVQGEAASASDMMRAALRLPIEPDERPAVQADSLEAREPGTQADLAGAAGPCA